MFYLARDTALWIQKVATPTDRCYYEGTPINVLIRAGTPTIG